MSQRFLFACPTGSVKIEIKPFHPEGTVSSSKKDAKDDAEDDDEVIIKDQLVGTNFRVCLPPIVQQLGLCLQPIDNEEHVLTIQPSITKSRLSYFVFSLEIVYSCMKLVLQLSLENYLRYGIVSVLFKNNSLKIQTCIYIERDSAQHLEGFEPMTSGLVRYHRSC